MAVHAQHSSIYCVSWSLACLYARLESWCSVGMLCGVFVLLGRARLVVSYMHARVPSQSCQGGTQRYGIPLCYAAMVPFMSEPLLRSDALVPNTFPCA